MAYINSIINILEQVRNVTQNVLDITEVISSAGETNCLRKLPRSVHILPIL